MGLDPEGRREVAPRGVDGLPPRPEHAGDLGARREQVARDKWPQTLPGASRSDQADADRAPG
jgi:hypothetical protein